VIGTGVIQGWSEGVQLMTLGSRAKFTIPSDLGYGPAGRGSIPPSSTPIFDIELLSIVSIPVFKQANLEAQKTTWSGLKYEILKAGEGQPCAKEQVFKLRYAIFTAEGELLECTEQNNTHITGRIEDMAVLFLKEAPLLMERGAHLRLEVPPNLGIPNLPGTTVWELEMMDITEPPALPDFSLSAEDKMTTTSSGLRYEVIKAGEGASPTATDTVTVHYAGWLTDGTLFDASYNRGTTASFPLNRVIPGWTEGIQLMKVGGTYKFTIPGDLAYGAQGSPPTIPPNATLVFYVELLKIN
jgi:FKBP-type peptidyl-prolyl cis-trans isomerase